MAVQILISCVRDCLARSRQSFHSRPSSISLSLSLSFHFFLSRLLYTLSFILSLPYLIFFTSFQFLPSSLISDFSSFLFRIQRIPFSPSYSHTQFLLFFLFILCKTILSFPLSLSLSLFRPLALYIFFIIIRRFSIS